MKTFIKLVAMCAVLLIVGCATTEPTIETTKVWEGRYTSLEEASRALDKAATTENDLQVWLLQPSTLSRLLRNVEK